MMFQRVLHLPKKGWTTVSGEPKIQLCQCRIIKDSLSSGAYQRIENTNDEDEILRLVKKRNNDSDHYYFYWVVEDPLEITDFEKRYQDAYNLKCGGMLKALKGR